MIHLQLFQRNFGVNHESAFTVDAKEDFDLEEVFSALNGMGRYAYLRSFAYYSLSVGDYIGMAPDGKQFKYFRVDAVGWTEVTVEEATGKVA